MLPAKDVRISAPYGIRGPWAAGYHTGTDFACDVGTPIHATKGGTVVFAGYHNGWGAAYGNHVIVNSVYNGKVVRHMYAHLSTFAVKSGQQIKDGQTIGRSGNTGNTSGPHCHYEERHYPFGYYDNQKPVLLAYKPADPRVFIRVSKAQPGKTNKHVRRLKRRMNKYFPKKKPLWGPFFTKELRERYAEYQRHLGYKGINANGRPGVESLKKLGFRVGK